MCRSRHPDLRAGLFNACVLLLGLIPAEARCATDAQPAWFLVHANADLPADERLLLRDVQDQLWAQRSDLESWGLRDLQGPAEVRDDTEWFALDAQPGLRTRFDSADQSLWLDLAPELRTIQVRSLRDTRGLHDERETEAGGWLDADAQLMHDTAGTQFASLVGGRYFRGRAFGGSDALASERGVVRLDTRWSIEDPDAMERTELGDGVVRGGSWGRALRFGGVSLGTDFALQPDLVTFPQPEVRGLAELPSTVDVYVNGLLTRREEVNAGPFLLSGLPVQEGANRTRVVVRDALGRERELSQSFYAPAQLLKPGLREARLDAGWLREDYGLRSFAYGNGFLAGNLRRGLSETLTFESRVEAATRRQAGGVSAALGLPFGGVAEAALAGSHAPTGVGGLLRAGYDWQSNTGWSAGTRWRQVSRHWTDLGETEATRRQQWSTHLGLAPAPGWSTTLTWVRQSRREESAQQLLALAIGTRLAHGWSLGCSAVTDLSGGDAGFLALNLIGRFGGGTAVLEARHAAGQDIGAFEWQQVTDSALDPSLRLRAESTAAGLPPRAQIETRVPGERGEIEATLAGSGTGMGVRVGGATRLAWLGPDRFWTRPGAEGFAVIDAHGLADVGVLQDQRLAGRTDARGLALIPGVRAYEPNRYALVDADVPVESEVASLDQSVTPAARGAVRVAFPVRAARRHSLRLLMDDGTPPPAGTRVTDPLTGLRLPLGRDGQAWWSHGELPDQLVADTGTARCHARIPRDAGLDPTIRLKCEASP